MSTLTLPSMLYSNKTKTYWMVKSLEYEHYNCIQMKERSEVVEIPKEKIEAAIKDGVMVVDEHQSKLLQVYANQPVKKKRK
jgi:hypothetical protein